MCSFHSFFSRLCLLSLYKSFVVNLFLCAWVCVVELASACIDVPQTHSPSGRLMPETAAEPDNEQADTNEGREITDSMRSPWPAFSRGFPACNALQHLSMLASWRTPTVWRNSQHRFTKQTSCCLVVFCFWVKKLLEASAGSSYFHGKCLECVLDRLSDKHLPSSVFLISCPITTSLSTTPFFIYLFSFLFHSFFSLLCLIHTCRSSIPKTTPS